MVDAPEMINYDEFHRIDSVAVYLEEDGSRERVTIGDVADRFYDEVERRIKLEDYEPPKRDSKMGQNADNGSRKEQVADQHFQEWLDDLSGVHATLEATLDEGTRYEKTYEYELSPRTDFAFNDVQTAPNVIKVLDEDAMRFGIRIWEQYDADDPCEQVRKDTVDRSMVDPDELGDDYLHRMARYGKHFNRNSHDDEFYEMIGTPEYDPDAFDGGITMIPELYLETALHKTDGVYEQGVPPVTPYNIKVMDVEEDRAFVMRPWLFNTFDGGISRDSEKDRLATFYGTCQALNLVGCFDRGNRRQSEFYDDARDGQTSTVFIDPEMWAYTDRDGWFRGSDWEDFMDQLKTHGNATTSFIEDVKEQKWQVAAETDYDGDILEEVPRSIDKELFPEPKQVSVAAPQD